MGVPCRRPQRESLHLGRFSGLCCTKSKFMSRSEFALRCDTWRVFDSFLQGCLPVCVPVFSSFRYHMRWTVTSVGGDICAWFCGWSSIPLLSVVFSSRLSFDIPMLLLCDPYAS